MANIVLRSVKGSPLTIEEADSNFSNINTEVGTKLDAADYTAAEILSLLAAADEGNGNSLNAATVQSLGISSTSTADTIVRRDSSGDFSSNTITATSFIGPLTGNVVGNVTGTVTGNATNVDGVIEINHGGTGATTAEAARTALGLGDLAAFNASDVEITGGSITGITPLAVADGGTGANNATTARTNLGLAIGSDVMQYSNTLAAFTGVTSNGIVVKTAAGNATSRSISGAGNVSVTNGNGVDGNITITGSTTPSVSSITKTGTTGSGDIGQSTNKFNYVYATIFSGESTTAKYADLAEKYLADQEYPVGTVVCVGGEAEVTAANFGDLPIGVVSENPAFKMNSDLEGGTYIALKGRVPVRITGTVRKGQRLVANKDGVATAGVPHSGGVFAVALEDGSDGLIEAVIL